MSSNAYARKKQPEVVRRALLDSAAQLAIAEGLAGVTVQAVALAAGVTKGGLFHHFPSKQALIAGLYADLMGQMDAEIDARMAQDPTPLGRFTRAYVETILSGEDFSGKSPWPALSATMMAEPAMGQLWTSWIEGQLERHKDTDSAPILEVVRYAADGAWFTYIDKAPSPTGLAGLRERLIAMTR